VSESAAVELASLGLLTLSEAAARRNVHERTLRRWVGQGMPHVPVGGQGERAGYFLFRASDVDAWTPPRGRGAPAGNRNAAKSKKSGARKAHKNKAK
jgi:excisionase family DNA binding protein